MSLKDTEYDHLYTERNQYIDILVDYLFPSVDIMGYGDRFFIQEDNASSHKLELSLGGGIIKASSCYHDPQESPDLNSSGICWEPLLVAFGWNSVCH